MLRNQSKAKPGGNFAGGVPAARLTVRVPRVRVTLNPALPSPCSEQKHFFEDWGTEDKQAGKNMHPKFPLSPFINK